MRALSAESEVILRNEALFSEASIYFSGCLCDDLPVQLSAKKVNVHCTQYHYWHYLNKQLGDCAQFSLLPDCAAVASSDTLIYYWPKSKVEAQFQLSALLSQIVKGTRIYIIGENRSGVRSAEKLLAEFGFIQKIDTARRCSLYLFEPECRLEFDLDTWWSTYSIDTLRIKALPGVFSRDRLDEGSELLLSVLLEEVPEGYEGSLLEIGCGAGVLAAFMAKQCPNSALTFSDVNVSALVSTKETLAINQLKANVIASDVFSDISQRFDIIFSNPPFHDGRQTDLSAARKLLLEAKNHLPIGGKLYIVANAFLPYQDILDDVFGQHTVLAQTGKFKVYLAQRRAPRGNRPHR